MCKIGFFVCQEPIKQKTVYEYFSENENFWDKSPKELSMIANKFAIGVDFFYSSQIMQSLSDGEKIKAQLMRLLISEPTVLLLDEPSNDIDVATLELLEKVILEWDKIVLFISHDEVLIERTANMVIHLEQIERKTKPRYTVAKMSYHNYIDERLKNFERQEQQALNDKRQQKIRDEKYKRVYDSVASALENCSRQCPDVAKNLKDKMHTVKAMQKRFEREDENMTQNYEDLLRLDETPVDFLDTTGEKEKRTRIRTYLGSLKYTADEMDHPMREFPGAVISVSHDRKYISEVFDKTYELSFEGLR